MSCLYQKGIHLVVPCLARGAAAPPKPPPPLRLFASHHHAARRLHDFELRRDSATMKSLSILPGLPAMVDTRWQNKSLSVLQ